jgi:hypothetical protein
MDSTVAAKRYTTSLGVDGTGKLSKENAALIKAFEQKLTAYKTRIQTDKFSQQVNAMLQNEQSIEPEVNVIIVDGADSLESSVEDIVNKLHPTSDLLKNTNEESLHVNAELSYGTITSPKARPQLTVNEDNKTSNALQKSLIEVYSVFGDNFISCIVISYLIL